MGGAAERVAALNLVGLNLAGLNLAGLNLAGLNLAGMNLVGGRALAVPRRCPMIATTTLAPHDPMPSGRHVIVMRRFEEDDPGRTTVQIVLTGTPEQSTHPRRPDGTPMHLDEAIDAARRVAESEGLDRVYVLDRVGGVREQEILRHDGDHTVHMGRLVDADDEDGERGPDMRDIGHPAPSGPAE